MAEVGLTIELLLKGVPLAPGTSWFPKLVRLDDDGVLMFDPRPNPTSLMQQLDTGFGSSVVHKGFDICLSRKSRGTPALFCNAAM